MIEFVFNVAMRKVLSGNLPAEKIKRIKRLSAYIHQNTAASADKGANLSIDLLLALARCNVAFYKALLQEQVDADAASQYIEQVNWQLSRLLGKPVFIMSRLFASGGKQRLDWSNNVVWKYLFRQPFKREAAVLASDRSNENDLAFNVTHCPFQEYYRAQNVLEVCEFAACNQDHRLAKGWNAEFKRTKTLANGDDCCDFRFTAIES